MSQAVFRETADLPAENRSLLASVDPRDVGLVVGLVAVGVGFAMAWLPLGLIVPGGILTVVSLWAIVRRPQ